MKKIMMTHMSMRDRMLAVIQGREHDRVPFVQYDNLAAPNEEIWSMIGRDNMGILHWSSVYRYEHPNCHFETENIVCDGQRGIRTIMYTPAGQLIEEKFYEPTFGTSCISKHYVKEPKDYRTLMAYLQDIIVCEDIDHFLRDQHEIGEDGLPHVAVGKTPYQKLWIDWVSLEALSFHLIDYPNVVKECIALLTQIMRRIFQIVYKAPVPYAVICDNITASVIGEKYFRKYCLPLYNELSWMLADKNIPVFVHMDGNLKPLWEAIGESGIHGIDSFSPPPDNDTSAAQAISMWPEMRIWLNFPSSVHLASPKKIYSQTEQILTEAGHSGRLQIQISENVPPGVWKKSFPEIVKAIKVFGIP